jgi:hypothetical protein
LSTPVSIRAVDAVDRGPWAARCRIHVKDTEVTVAGKVKPQVIGDDEHQRVLGRVAAVDVARASGMVCTRLPGKGRRVSRVQEVTATMAGVTELGRQLMKGQSADGDA